MMATEDPVQPDAAAFHTDGLVAVAVYASEREALEHALVPLAMSLPCWVDADAEAHRLWVAVDAAEAVREQLTTFDRDNAGWPPPRHSSLAESEARPGWRGASVWAIVTAAAFAAQGEWPALTEAGALDARAMWGRGELWRAATALFLHADLGHLLSNLGGGFFLFALVLGRWGARRGAALLGLAAVAGNLLAAAIHGADDYRSIGASTAVFAALGLLTGRALRELGGWSAARMTREMFATFAAGLTTLALFGAGEARVDVLAHVTGFGAGLVAGWLAGIWRDRSAGLRESGRRL